MDPILKKTSKRVRKLDPHNFFKKIFKTLYQVTVFDALKCYSMQNFSFILLRYILRLQSSTFEETVGSRLQARNNR